MKFKKIITVFFIIILMFIFNFNVSADVINVQFTNTYRHTDVQLYALDASLYAFNNFPITSYATNKHLRLFLISSDLINGDRLYRQILIGYNEEDCQIKIYDGYVYMYIKGLAVCDRRYYQDVLTGSISNAGGSTVSFSSNYKAVLKLSKDNIKFKIRFTDSTINSVDEYITEEITNSFTYFNGDEKFNNVEYNSIGSLTGETYQNNADIRNPTYYGTLLSDKQEFINWIIENEKYVVFGDYGIQNTFEFVDDVVSLYETYQKNPLKLFLEIPHFIIKNGSIFSTVDKAKELINYVSALYQEFKLERRPVIYRPELQPYIFPKPWIDDAPNEKYVDNAGDSVEIGLLKEILRSIIITPQNLFNFFDYYIYNISVNTSLLADYVAQLPQYLSNLIYNNFFEDINYIKNALDNLSLGGGSDLINVEITTEKETEINTFFNDWNIQFSNKINEKIPVISQIGSLFSTFWEQTNVIKNENELPVYNYNQFLNDSDALTAISGVFDNSNKDYLTNINSPFIPSFTIRIGGVSHEIINFKFYAKYRSWIHNLITFILWFFFLLSLYKSIPNIIGRVAGLDKFLETHNEGVKDAEIENSYTKDGKD